MEGVRGLPERVGGSLLAVRPSHHHHDDVGGEGEAGFRDGELDGGGAARAVGD